MEPNDILLNDATSDLFKNASQILEEYDDFISYGGHDSDSPEFNDETTEFDERLEWVILNLFTHIATLAEKIGLGSHAMAVRDDLNKIRSGELLDISLNDIKRHDRADVFYSPAVQHLRVLYAPIASLMSLKVKTTSDVLERILKRTPEIVSNKYGSKGASKEKDVELALHEILEHSFPDAASQITIPQKTKNYVMDLAVHSLMTGVEVKFAKNKRGFKKVVGEIYTDMKGYSGDHKWRKFYALIYLKNHISDAEKLFDEFKEVNAPLHWIPIIVTELKPPTT